MGLTCPPDIVQKCTEQIFRGLQKVLEVYIDVSLNKVRPISKFYHHNVYALRPQVEPRKK